MSWSDKMALEQIKKLRDYYDIFLFIETGTFKGINAAVHGDNFLSVLTIEKVPEYYSEALKKVQHLLNVWPVLGDSPDVLKSSGIRHVIALHEVVLIYLDAHFYDAALPPEERWVILRELEALKDTPNVVLVIHDFDNGLGHLTYDGQPMNFEFLQSALNKVNPNFHFYTNTRATCDIITKDRVVAGEIPNLVLDAATADNLDYAWSSDEKAYRGILYCTPTELDLSQFQLVKLC